MWALHCVCGWVGAQTLKGRDGGAGQVKCASKLWRVPALAVSQYRSLHVNTAAHSWAGLIGGDEDLI